jgi:hypothetical protein
VVCTPFVRTLAQQQGAHGYVTRMSDVARIWLYSVEVQKGCPLN